MSTLPVLSRNDVRRLLVGALGLAVGWELIEGVAGASPLAGALVLPKELAAVGAAWPLVRAALHFSAAAAATLALGCAVVLAGPLRALVVVYAVGALAVHGAGAWLQATMVGAARDAGRIAADAETGLLATFFVSFLVGAALPVVTLVLAWRAPRAEGRVPRPALIAAGGVVLLGAILAVRAFVLPEPALRDALAAEAADDRARAATRLRALKLPLDDATLRALAATLEDDDGRVARASARALAEAGPRSIDALRASLVSDSARTRLRAVEIVRRVGRDAGAKAARALADRLDDDDPRVRAAAARGLSRFGPDALDVLDTLIARLSRDDLDRPTRVTLEEAVVSLGPMAVEKLAAAYRDGNATVRDPLLRLGTPGKLTVHLFDLTHDEVPRRFVAARALEDLGPDAAPASMVLVEVVQKDASDGVRAAAARALVAIGPAAKDAVTRARATVDDSAAPWLDYVLDRVDAPTRGPSHTARPDRARLLTALEERAPTPEELPVLLDVITDERALSVERANAARAVGQLDGAGEAGVKTLQQAIASHDWALAEAALSALLALGHPAPVVEEVTHPQEARRLRAVHALARAPEDTVGVLDALVAALADPLPSVRVAAADALLALGPDVDRQGRARAALEAAVGDEDAGVRAHAARALEAFAG